MRWVNFLFRSSFSSNRLVYFGDGYALHAFLLRSSARNILCSSPHILVSVCRRAYFGASYYYLLHSGFFFLSQVIDHNRLADYKLVQL